MSPPVFRAGFVPPPGAVLAGARRRVLRRLLGCYGLFMLIDGADRGVLHRPLVGAVTPAVLLLLLPVGGVVWSLRGHARDSRTLDSALDGRAGRR